MSTTCRDDPAKPRDTLRLKTFVKEMGQLLDEATGEPDLLQRGRDLLRRLVAQDDWLPPAFAEADPLCYRQYLLHCDSQERFCVVSFVWSRDQATPVHDHGVWGMVGVLRGAELVRSFKLGSADSVEPDGPPRLLERGAVEIFSPAFGDLHSVANGHAGGETISIHVYGGNIGAMKRTSYGSEGPRSFVSGYSNAALPNFWAPRP